MSSTIGVQSTAELTKALVDAAGLGAAGLAILAVVVVAVLGIGGLGSTLSVLFPRLVAQASSGARSQPLRSLILGVVNLVAGLVLMSLGDAGVPLGKLVALAALLYLLALSAVAVGAAALLVGDSLLESAEFGGAATVARRALLGGAVFGAASLVPLVGQTVGFLVVVATMGSSLDAWWLLRRTERRAHRGPVIQDGQGEQPGSGDVGS
ncbi:MAG: hypothetical protein HYV63_15375 [Candidatus Schekmanbacteria bacterium]|nr:hypothetical protein [Candidatus Schekmanbacteria bacterium]